MVFFFMNVKIKFFCFFRKFLIFPFLSIFKNKIFQLLKFQILGVMVKNTFFQKIEKFLALRVKDKD